MGKRGTTSTPQETNKKRRTTNRSNRTEENQALKRRSHHQDENESSGSPNQLASLNSNIAYFSARRRFGDAVAEFHRISSLGFAPNESSYLHIINACCRAGLPKRALTFMTQCEAQFGTSLREATFLSMKSSLIRGYSDILEVGEAFKILVEFGLKKLNPRVVNAFLRGCLKSGNSQEAYFIFKHLLKNPVAIDITSLALITELLCFAGHYQEALELHDSLFPHLSTQENLPYVVDMAGLRIKVLLSLHYRRLRKEAKLTARELIDKLKSSTGLENYDISDLQATHKGADVEAFPSIENKTTHENSISDGQDPTENKESKSHQLFLLHKAEELLRALKQMKKQPPHSYSEQFLYFCADAPTAQFSSDSQIETSALWGSRCLPLLKGLLDFHQPKCDPFTINRLADLCQLSAGEMQREETMAKSENLEGTKSKGTPKHKKKNEVTLTNETTKEETSREATRRESREERLRYKRDKLNNNLAWAAQMTKTVLENISSKFGDSSREVVVELGSGGGDWIHSIASSSPHMLFIANELRWNRCCEISQKGFIENMVVLGGDGKYILSDVLPSSVSDWVFINFPEPPHIKDGPDAFIDTELFNLIRKVLKPKGKCVIVSDQKLYLSFVSGTFVKALCPQTFRALTFKHPYHFVPVSEVDEKAVPRKFLEGGSYFDVCCIVGKIF
eukprot:Gregarina_sp_Poly_1__6597@NODE_353_length_9300_cov_96_781761_g295_i0_p1_GENE_NODE_353_length_9300_cov_96_781761_g295_i0NODE_353_length_9300_cov_96_781761_g295_i0_p1_ORF_typecomplete_len678_score104_24PPR_long/PF17177_4/1_1e09PPR_long/PF17177_4/1_7e06PPR_long/PF17177_4/1_6e03Methyltransf_4/PF02390_17/1_1e04Methyltransf_4/PF02390_17/8_7e13PPR_2/PF13041_6/0_0017PPR_2/PF13041_6/1_2e02PPR_2/PF13041_6/0_39PPR_2/PF13041_6/3_5e02PPR_2/PF13041_6/1e04PPR_3/PF13812_6/0_0024PPR_3/PF13812_6/0_18PPR_3/PF13812